MDKQKVAAELVQIAKELSVGQSRTALMGNLERVISGGNLLWRINAAPRTWVIDYVKSGKELFKIAEKDIRKIAQLGVHPPQIWKHEVSLDLRKGFLFLLSDYPRNNADEVADAARQIGFKG